MTATTSLCYLCVNSRIRTISHFTLSVQLPTQNRCKESSRSGIGGRLLVPESIPPNSVAVSTDTAFVIMSEQLTRVLTYVDSNTPVDRSADEAPLQMTRPDGSPAAERGGTHGAAPLSKLVCPAGFVVFYTLTHGSARRHRHRCRRLPPTKAFEHESQELEQYGCVSTAVQYAACSFISSSDSERSGSKPPGAGGSDVPRPLVDAATARFKRA